MPVKFEELGLKFVSVCAGLYWENIWYLLLFAAGLGGTLIWGRKKDSRVFVYYTVILLLTIYNPLIANVFVEKMHFENEYYRFFWVLPVIPAVAYYGVQVVSYFKKKSLKAVVVACVLAVFVVLGNPIQGVTVNFAFAQNLYKVPNALRGICDVLHQLKGEGMPTVVFENDLNTVVRQYDAGIRLVLNRDVALYVAGSRTSEYYNENSDYYKQQKAILDVVDYDIYDAPDDFKKALKETKTEFLVISKSAPNQEFFENVGCTRAAESGDYYIYSYDAEG